MQLRVFPEGGKQRVINQNESIMSSYRQIIYHIVFRTKKNERTLSISQHKELYCYVMGILKNKNCYLYRINGTDDHIHMLISLHPSIALADLMRDLKTSSSLWLKEHHGFPRFNGWADGYAALTYSNNEKESLINYIKNQQEHHKDISFKEELKGLLVENGVEINEKYFF